MEINTSKLTKEAKDTYNGVAKAAEHAGNKIEVGADSVLEKAKDLGSSLGDRYMAMREGTINGYETAVSAVKKYPLYAVAGSAAIGLFAGALLARRNK